MNSCSGLLGLFHPAAAESGEQGDFIRLTGIVEFQQGLSGGENIALGAQDFDIADRAVAIERSGALQGYIQRGEIALLRGNLIGGLWRRASASATSLKADWIFVHS